MKVIAVGSKRPLTPEQRQKYLPTEVPNTLKLYLDGKIEQFWYRQNSAGVIFLMNVESLEEAKVLTTPCFSARSVHSIIGAKANLYA